MKRVIYTTFGLLSIWWVGASVDHPEMRKAQPVSAKKTVSPEKKSKKSPAKKVNKKAVYNVDGAKKVPALKKERSVEKKTERPVTEKISEAKNEPQNELPNKPQNKPQDPFPKVALPLVNNKPNRPVVGDTGDPLIDLDSVTLVNPMMLTNDDPADHLPWKSTDYYHFAKNQELKELVRNFCMTQAVDVFVSDAIKDVVNGKFSNISPRQFWKDIVNAYGLVWFYDGSMMYVYKSSEVQSNVFQMSRDEMRTLIKVIAQLGFLSSNINFRPLEAAGILVVSGPPKLMEMITELSQKVVVERVSDVYDIQTFPLKHAWAYDMTVNYRGGTMKIPGVASMLQQIISTMPGPISEANLGVSIDNQHANAAVPLEGVAGTAVKRAEQKKETASNTNNDSGENKSNYNIGNMFITYDTRLNAVIVKAKHQDMRFIEKIIQQLDVARDAIRIDVAVVDITRSGVKKIGSKLTAKLRSDHANNAAVNGNYSVTETGAEFSNAFTFNLGHLLKGYSFEETLNILEDVGNAQTLTRSSVITLDNIGATIDRSSTVYVAVKGNESESLYDVTVSTKLVVVPHIIPGIVDEKGNPKIKLLIEVADGNFNQNPTTGGGTTEPKTDTNTVNTEASVFEGQSLFIGGYFHEHHSKNSAGVPVLKDLPLLGNLFKTAANEDSVAERIYIITPSLVDTEDRENKAMNRFFTHSQLSGVSTLSADEFNLAKNYTVPNFSDTSYSEELKPRGWKKVFAPGEKHTLNEEEKEKLHILSDKVRKRRHR